MSTTTPARPLAPPAENGREEAQRALGADIRLLGDVLGSTIRRLAGEEAFTLVEEVRAAAKLLRSRHSVAEARLLRDRLAGLELPALRTLTRAFNLYFDLINLAEQRARLRALRQRARASREPVPESIAAALHQLKDRGVGRDQVVALLERGVVAPVFTAHPSESRRRTVREKLDAVAAHLDRLECGQPLPHEREAALAAIAEEVETFWLTGLVRDDRPTALDEVSQGLGVVGTTLFEVVPVIYRNAESAFRRVYPEVVTANAPPFLRFGGWIGGDRDGNPNVTHEVTAETVRLQQIEVLGHYLERVEALGRRLSHATPFVRPGEAFVASLSADAALVPEAARGRAREPYRAKCRVIAARLRSTLEHVKGVNPQWAIAAPAPPAAVYATREALLADLTVLDADLRRSGSDAAAGPLRDLIHLVRVFGLHFLKLDVRQHSRRHAQAMEEVLAAAGITPRYRKLTPNERFDVLAKELQQSRPLIPVHLAFTPDACEVIQTFRTVAALLSQQCPDAIENYIISGASEPAHLLEVLLLAREAGLFRPAEGVSRLNVVPLYEDMRSLEDAATITQRVLNLPVYRDHLRLRGDVQEVMLGYSDSNKETGVLQSSWALYRAQRVLADAARRTNIRVQFFHGRGGAVGRGGGPANRAILAQPAQTVEGRLRFTEQGEMMADRYGSPGVAERHLEQIVNAVLRTSFAGEEEKPSPTWERILERLAERACRHYRAMVYETPEFVTYFEQATPIEEIAQLKLGSRPTRRTTSRRIDDLRAIPWVFGWMQSRHTLPGWFGLGGAVREYLEERPEDRETLCAMYQRWPFWRALIDNVQMILAKADMTIARLYADLIEDQALATRLFDRLSAEYERTVEVIRLLTGQAELLDNMPVLQRSIQMRNPYVDPLSFVQLVLLRRLRAAPEPDSDLLTGVLESINGIASA